MSVGNVLKKKYDGLEYEYVVKGKDRGEVRILGKNRNMIIPTFPHIKRIFSLSAGFKHLGRTAWVEEKVDGYNLRVVCIDGNLYAFTRGGVLCPFSTEKVRELKKLNEFFIDNPDIVVNGEMAGPNNPYIKQWPPYVKRDVKFFIFDMMQDGKFLDIKTRLDLVDTYELDHVRYFGSLDVDGVKNVVMQHYTEMEGIVLKSEDRKLAVKYVFPDSDIDDIRVGVVLFPEIKPGYYLQRLVRSAIFLNENKIDPERYYNDIGKAFIDGFEGIVGKILDGGEIYEDFTIFVKNPKTANDLVNLFSEHIHVEVVEIKKMKKQYMVTIRKYYPEATRYWRERLHGKLFVD